MQTLKDNILKLRKINGYTQNELANFVGVSAGAVSKWERGHAYPDISLLAPLARALHTTIDELLQFQTALTKEEVQTMKQEMIANVTTLGYASTQQKIDQLLNEYPHDVGLKLSMASVLYMNLPHLGNDEEVLKSKLHDIRLLLEDIISTKQAPYVQQASYLYAILLLDNEEYDACEQLLEEMASTSLDITTLYLNLYQRQNKKEDVIQLAQKTLLDGILKTTMSLSIMASNAKDEQALRFIQDNDQLYEKFQFSYRQPQRELMKYYLKHKELEAAAIAYECYIKSIVELPLNKYDNLYFSTCKLEYNDSAQLQMRKKMLEMERNDESLVSLQAYPAYQRAMTMIEDYLKD